MSCCLATLELEPRAAPWGRRGGLGPLPCRQSQHSLLGNRGVWAWPGKETSGGWEPWPKRKRPLAAGCKVRARGPGQGARPGQRPQWSSRSPSAGPAPLPPGPSSPAARLPDTPTVTGEGRQAWQGPAALRRQRRQVRVGAPGWGAARGQLRPRGQPSSPGPARDRPAAASSPWSACPGCSCRASLRAPQTPGFHTP